MCLWLVEEIPSNASLFYRFPVGQLRPDDPKPFPGMFRENRGSISTDWDKYSTAAQTRARQGGPERFAVLKMVVGGVREIRELRVVHSPIQNRVGLPDNRAHADIFGLDEVAPTVELGRKERIRTELYKRFNTWEIAPDAPVEMLTTSLESSSSEGADEMDSQ
jgi:hypothetical protein